MNKTIQRPLACRNAHCGAMCAIADAEFWGEYPNCPNYERRDDLYQNHELLDKIKQARKEIENIEWKTFKSKVVEGKRVSTELIDRADVLEILDKLIEEGEALCNI